MKRLLLLACFIILLSNCSDQLEFNTQTFHATKDLSMWRASDFNVNFIKDGSINITGIKDNEIVTLHLANISPGVYPLGVDPVNNAFFKTTNELIYSTINDGEGEVVIEEYNEIEQTFSGTFKFSAFAVNGDGTTFIDGVFYRVPIIAEAERPDGELSATVDGTNLNAEDVITTINTNLIESTAIAQDGSYIKLIMPETIGAGSYNLNEQSASNTHAIYGFAGGVATNSQFGTMFISQHDVALRRIKGSFSFQTLLPNKVSVENGNFTIYY